VTGRRRRAPPPSLSTVFSVGVAMPWCDASARVWSYGHGSEPHLLIGNIYCCSGGVSVRRLRIMMVGRSCVCASKTRYEHPSRVGYGDSEMRPSESPGTQRQWVMS
jgi:hypothetical protein